MSPSAAGTLVPGGLGKVPLRKCVEGVACLARQTTDPAQGQLDPSWRQTDRPGQLLGRIRARHRLQHLGALHIGETRGERLAQRLQHGGAQSVRRLTGAAAARVSSSDETG